MLDAPFTNDNVKKHDSPAGELVTIGAVEQDHVCVKTPSYAHEPPGRDMFSVSRCPATNAAVTFFAAVITTWPPPVPLQSPLQPLKNAVPDGVSLSVTVTPSANDAVHVPGQLIPAGELVTVPVGAVAGTVTVKVHATPAQVSVTEEVPAAFRAP